MNSVSIMDFKAILKKKEFYIISSVILLLAYLIIRLINQSQMIAIFPIDAFANDYSSHISRLWFLAEYGTGPIPFWYNGNFLVLSHYPPLWYVMSLPLYWITKNPQAAAYFSLVMMYIVSLIVILFFGKTQNLSRAKSFALFSFFFINPIAIGYFLRLGKLPEMLGWLFSFLFLLLLFYYKERKLDWKFIFFIPLYTLIHYSHILVFIVVSIPVIGLFLIKGKKERIIIAVSAIATSITTYPFWSIFIKGMSENKIGSYFSLQWLVQPGNTVDKITSIIIPLIFMVIFYLYYQTIKQNKQESRKELVFYLPIILLGILYATRLACFIPFINRPTPDTYNLLFIFLFSFLFLKTDFSRINMQRYVQTALIIAVTAGIILSAALTPWFQPHTSEVKDTLKILEDVDSKFIILKEPPSVSGRSVYSYAPIYLNLSTPSGWAPLNITSEYSELLSSPNRALNEKNCTLLKESMKSLKTYEVVTFNDYCDFLRKTCQFNKKSQINNVCLYRMY